MFHLLLPSPKKRQALISHLKARSILAVFHYLPLHLSEYGRRFASSGGGCPVSEDLSGRLLRLPFYNSMTPAEQTRVIEALHEFPRT